MGVPAKGRRPGLREMLPPNPLPEDNESCKQRPALKHISNAKRKKKKKKTEEETPERYIAGIPEPLRGIRA